LVALERRLRAAQEAGLAEIPIVIKELTDFQALEVAIQKVKKLLASKPG
jgi:ParB family transcriptional regulator, chromosome partitioning protein